MRRAHADARAIGDADRNKGQAQQADDRRGGEEGAGVNQLLAQPALIYGIKLERRLVAAIGLDLGRFGLKRLVDMGLDGQVLEKESEQRQSGDPPPGRTRRRKEAGATRQ